MLVIMKFGGTIIKQLGYSCMNRLISETYPMAKVVAVVSAPKGVTDLIDKAARRAETGDEKSIEEALAEIRKEYVQVILKSSDNDSKATDLVDSNLDELKKVLYGIVHLRELTRSTLDYALSYGEMISSKLGAHMLSNMGIRSVGLSGKEAGIVTDEEFGNAKPLMNLSQMKIRSTVAPLIEKGIVAIVGGYCGATQNGRVTTLGRGGSDYTATILAAALNADQVCLWTDVDGIMTADPKIVPDATTIPELTYREATELFLLGGKFIHPRTLLPVAPLGIKVAIRNAFRPEKPGTAIASSAQSLGKVVKAVSLIRDVVMFTLLGPSMVARSGTVRMIFNSIDSAGAEVIMLAQSASEVNFGIVVRREYADKVHTVLEVDLLGKVLDEIKVDDNICVVAAVGEGMRGSSGVASKIFDAVARKNINVRMIAASSEINISFVVSKGDEEETVRTVHDVFKLNELS